MAEIIGSYTSNLARTQETTMGDIYFNIKFATF